MSLKKNKNEKRNKTKKSTNFFQTKYPLMSVGSFEHNLHRCFKSQVEKVIEMTYFYEEIIQSEKDTKRKLRNTPRLTAFGCFIHWCPAQDFSFPFQSVDTQNLNSYLS